MKRRVLLFFLIPVYGNVFGQAIICDNAAIAEAYEIAIKTVDMNIHDGILAAGADYGGKWTRDIAINSWNGVSLIRPQVIEQSLWSVTIHHDTIGHQYWDKIIWAIAAYDYYKVTGNLSFLKQAYICSANTMQNLEQITFNKNLGLFMGPSVFNDGIAAYPEPIYEPNNFSGGVLDHKNSYHIKCLSTNCLYYGAFLVLHQMSILLNENDDVTRTYLHKAESLKKNIITHFYHADSNSLNYLIDHLGTVNTSQEGLGISFAVVFGILQGDTAKKLIRNAFVSKFGIPSIYPDFPRYSEDKPGRHNNLIWPMVNGFFAKAAILTDNYESFDKELNGLTHLALDHDKGDHNFREIYNPNSGKPDGGYQDWGEERPNYHWASCRSQTWSATAYMNMIYFGLLGLRIENDSISFSPYLPNDIHHLEIKNIHYHQSELNITVTGNGHTIKSFLLNGKTQLIHTIHSDIKGTNEIAIEVE